MKTQITSTSAKSLLRQLFRSSKTRLTLDQIIAKTGKTESNVKTALYDLRNPKYAGGELLVIKQNKRGKFVRQHQAAA